MKFQKILDLALSVMQLDCIMRPSTSLAQVTSLISKAPPKAQTLHNCLHIAVFFMTSQLILTTGLDSVSITMCNSHLILCHMIYMIKIQRLRYSTPLIILEMICF